MSVVLEDNTTASATTDAHTTMTSNTTVALAVNSTALDFNKTKQSRNRNAHSQSSATADAHMTMTPKTTVAIAAISTMNRNALSQSSVPRKVHANHSHAAVTATLSHTKAETNNTLSQSEEKPKSQAENSFAELDSLSMSTTGADTVNAIDKVDDLSEIQSVGRLLSLKQPIQRSLRRRLLPDAYHWRIPWRNSIAYQRQLPVRILQRRSRKSTITSSTYT
jgi:hypothetical protein